MAYNTFTVSELNTYIKGLLDSDKNLSKVNVRGELSNFTESSAGHCYFSMKDGDGTLRCVMFKGSASKLRFQPENGMGVIALGNVTVYQRDGQYQLYVEELIPDGVGNLYIAYEQLKEKLNKEGLFDARHKKALPRYPGTIAIVTSPTGAAVRDIIRILNERWPLTKVIVLPVRVQGAEAPLEIADAIKYANDQSIADLLITGRGGGSIEDLWAFNDEGVARAIFASVIPVISAVGHEPDSTISDFVADIRAATPSNAAQLAVPDINEVWEMLHNARARLRHVIHGDIQTLKQKIAFFRDSRAMQSPRYYVDDKRLMIDQFRERLFSNLHRSIREDKDQLDKYASAVAAHMQRRLYINKELFAKLGASLDAMSPLKVLGRGYSIARNKDGNVIKRASDVSVGDIVTVRLETDEINCEVIEQ